MELSTLWILASSSSGLNEGFIAYFLQSEFSRHQLSFCIVGDGYYKPTPKTNFRFNMDTSLQSLCSFFSHIQAKPCSFRTICSTIKHIENMVQMRFANANTIVYNFNRQFIHDGDCLQ